MRPLRAWPLAARAALVGVFTDIDDTLTTEGAITPDALEALADLRAAGLHVVAITGRPVGWSEPFAPAWPVDAIVAENGAVALMPPPPGGRATAHPVRQALPAGRGDPHAPTSRACSRCSRASSARSPAPAAPPTRAGRETDIAIDHSEFRTARRGDHRRRGRADARRRHARHRQQHPRQRLVRRPRQARRRALDRARTAAAARPRRRDGPLGLRRRFDQRPASCSSAFAHSVGVANIARFVPKLAHLPRYVTRRRARGGIRRGGAGGAGGALSRVNGNALEPCRRRTGLSEKILHPMPLIR